jgi:hypothetical protein
MLWTGIIFRRGGELSFLERKRNEIYNHLGRKTIPKNSKTLVLYTTWIQRVKLK